MLKLFRDGCGVLSLTAARRVNVHLLVLDPKYWRFGYCADVGLEEPPALPFLLREFGLGPLLLVCWYA